MAKRLPTNPDEVAFPGGGPRFEAMEARVLLDGSVIFNEIHYDPDVKTEPAEYLELYNTTADPIDISHWTVSDGVEFEFPETTTIGGYGYVVVAQDPATVLSKFGVSAFGPFVGQLANEGERIVLRDASGTKVDAVDYGAGFPWPTVGDAPGYSIELINPALDNDLGGNWRASMGSEAYQETIFDAGSEWSYAKGTSEPPADWRALDFTPPAGWTSGFMAVGYSNEGEELAFINTPLNDMRYSYSTVYLRKTFTLSDPSEIGGLELLTRYDDGINVWINGSADVNDNYLFGLNVDGRDLSHTDTARTGIDNVEFITNLVSNPQDYLVAGENVIAVQLLNSSLGGSTDAFFDAILRTTMGGVAGVTPGARNSVFAPNSAPQMRQVSHTPVQPVAGQDVTVTMKVTDPDGVASVTLDYQTVEPGDYITLSDPRYNSPVYWTTVTMRDDGLAGDATAGDSVYTVVLPGTVQQNRRLIRYRVTAEDTLGASVRGPYLDDPQPNFAYYVYDGVPSWTGSAQPGVQPNVEYSSELLTSLPVYTLLTKRQDHLNAMSVPYRWGASGQQTPTTSQYWGSDYPWQGALVYNGVVYDHVTYRARGGVWRYSMGKNMWKFDFNRNHYFQAYDDFGQPYATTWDKLNLGANIQQGDYWHRGEQGLFESAGFRMFNLAGVEAAKTSYAHFRIVEDGDEGGPDQYSTDFQGLYLVTEQPDGRFLDEHGLPDGNLYKMEGGTGELNNQGPTQPSDKSDLNAFMSAYQSNPSESWWRANVDLESYYSYRAVLECIHHGDVGYGKNYFFYNNPDTGIWSVVPWDLDLTWANTMYGNGEDPFHSAIMNNPTLRREYLNRLREVRDLLFNSDQAYQLIDEYAAMIDDPGGALSFVDADRAMWDYNPILVSSYVNGSKAGHGRFYAGGPSNPIPSPGGFRGMVQKMKNYVVRPDTGDWSSTNFYDGELIPNTPTVTYTGPGGYPGNELTFRSSNFSSGYGSFGAMEWRIAEVAPAGAPAYDPDNPRPYEIEALWESGEITSFTADAAIPASGIEAGHTYRVRVRMRDSLGRYSHWSSPAQFVAGARTGTPADWLRITELMYNPGAPTAAEKAAGYIDSDEFQYIEFLNTSTEMLDVEGIRFADGIEFTFPGITLYPDQYVLAVKNQAAFEMRYGVTHFIAGQFTSGSLNGDGEMLILEDPLTSVIQSFEYKDGWFDQTDGDGYSLVVRDPTQAVELWNVKDGWRASWQPGGNPEEADPGLNPKAVVINEILAHQDLDPPGDWIELYNATGDDIDIGGWYLSDDPSNLMKYRIADDTVIFAGDYAVFTEAANFGLSATGDSGRLVPFALSELGDEVCLTAAISPGVLAGYREDEPFGATANGVTLGRYLKSNDGKDFTALARPTMNMPNAVPIVGSVVINEVMYSPAVGGDEFIELLNVTGDEVPLYDPAHPENTWRLTDGVLFTFPGGAAIPAHGYALVVGIAPAAFRTKYGIAAEVPIYGPYVGSLENVGERIELSRPGTPEPLPPYTVPDILVDRVKYESVAPWPVEPDGTGPSLERVSAGSYGNDVANWAAGPAGGTPGAPNQVSPPHVVTVKLNGHDSRAVSTIEPSGIGIQTVTVAFNKPVTFLDSDVVVQEVAFDDVTGQEILGDVLTPTAVAGSGSDTMTITFDVATVVDTWVKVTLKDDGALLAGNGLPIDGEAKADGAGAGYLYQEIDMPTGNGANGGNAVFYVGSLRGDMWGLGFWDPEPDGEITVWDINGFTSKYQTADPDADLWGDGFLDPTPNGLVNAWDINAFTTFYQDAMTGGVHLAPLPAGGAPASAGAPVPLEAVTVLEASQTPAADGAMAALPQTTSLDVAAPEPVAPSDFEPGLTLVAAELAADASAAYVPQAGATAADDAALDPDGGLVDLLALPAIEMPLGV